MVVTSVGGEPTGVGDLCGLNFEEVPTARVIVINPVISDSLSGEDLGSGGIVCLEDRYPFLGLKAVPDVLWNPSP